jgi:hypothetical protein
MTGTSAVSDPFSFSTLIWYFPVSPRSALGISNLASSSELDVVACKNKIPPYYNI